MITIDQGARYTVSSGDNSGNSADLRDGTVVNLEILGPSKDGITAIRVLGKTMTARGIGSFPTGVLIPARVSVEDGTVYLRVLVPQAELNARATLAELSLPATPFSLRLVEAMRALCLKMDPTRMRSLLRVAQRFPGRQGDAAEAALMLSEAGLDPDDDSVADMLSMITGSRGSDGAGSKPGGSGGGGGGGADSREPSDGMTHSALFEQRRKLAARLNTPNTRERQWMIFPFERNIAGLSCSGSVRFLIDRISKTTIETQVFFSDGDRFQTFTLEGDACSFYADPAFLPVASREYTIYLSKQLSQFGINNVAYRELNKAIDGPVRVDLEA